jgi:hypothetical protein
MSLRSRSRRSNGSNRSNRSSSSFILPPMKLCHNPRDLMDVMLSDSEASRNFMLDQRRGSSAAPQNDIEAKSDAGRVGNDWNDWNRSVATSALASDCELWDMINLR